MPRTTATVDTSSKTQIAPTITYKLSDRSFLEAGWTTRPSAVQQEHQAVMMKAKFSHPDICPWFKEREEDVVGTYPTGQVLYVARKNGAGKVYYPNGRVAIHVEKTGAVVPRTKVWVYHSGEVDEDGVKRSAKFCALFESLGNGVVYDHCLRKRLVYNQEEGIWYDSSNGYPVRWRWHGEKPGNQPISVAGFDDTGSVMEILAKSTMFLPYPSKRMSNAVTSLTSSELYDPNRDLSKAELDFRSRMEHARYLDMGRMFPRTVTPVKPIVLRLNKNIALRIIDQSNISLSFCARGQQTQLRLGVLYNPFDKLKVTKVETEPGPNEILCPFENFPANTKSLLKFRRLMKKLKTKNVCSLTVQ